MRHRGTLFTLTHVVFPGYDKIKLPSCCLSSLQPSREWPRPAPLTNERMGERNEKEEKDVKRDRKKEKRSGYGENGREQRSTRGIEEEKEKREEFVEERKEE